MKTAIFSSHHFEKPFLEQANQAYKHELHFFEANLNAQTAVLADTYPAISCFVIDELSEAVLTLLGKGATLIILLRSAGFNHVNMEAAKRLGFIVTRVPAYSPYAALGRVYFI